MGILSRRVRIAALIATICVVLLGGAVLLGPSHEVSEDFSNAPDGVRTETASGQAVSLHPTTGPRSPRIKDGFLTFDPIDGDQGGYYTVKLSGPAAKAGAKFVFTPWSLGGGALSIAFMEKDIAETAPVVPRSPMHFVISPDSWGIQVFREEGETASSVVEGNFNPLLVADGTTLHEVSIELDSEAGSVRVTLPNGQTAEVSDPAMKVPAEYVFVETWKTGADTDKTLAKVRSWWADPS